MGYLTGMGLPYKDRSNDTKPARPTKLLLLRSPGRWALWV
jgi:hypothetical protein